MDDNNRKIVGISINLFTLPIFICLIENLMPEERAKIADNTSNTSLGFKL
jgi:hypothetical protein